jgi:peptidyl-dipeptidase Dcp
MEGFARHRSEIDAIVADESAPTFENTIVALERAGELLGQVARTFYTVSSADATPEIQEIEETLAPLMAAHHDAVQLDGALFARVRAVFDSRDEHALSAEERYLVERRFREMAHAGAGSTMPRSSSSRISTSGCRCSRRRSRRTCSPTRTTSPSSSTPRTSSTA